MPPGPVPPRAPCGEAASPRFWIAVPGPSSVRPSYGCTTSLLTRSAGMLSRASTGRPSLGVGPVGVGPVGVGPVGVGVTAVELVGDGRAVVVVVGVVVDTGGAGLALEHPPSSA